MHGLFGGVPDTNYLSVRASRCVQWLDRCLWISKSVALMEQEAFQEEDEDVSGGPELIRSILVRGHFWNFFLFFFFLIYWFLYGHLEVSFSIWGPWHEWALKCSCCLLPFLCEVSANTCSFDSWDLLLNLFFAVYLDLSSHIEQSLLLSNTCFFFYYLWWVLKIL